MIPLANLAARISTLALTSLLSFVHGQTLKPGQLLPSRGPRPFGVCGTSDLKTTYTPDTSLDAQVVRATVRGEIASLQRLLDQGAPAHAKALLKDLSTSLERMSGRPRSALGLAIEHGRWPQADLLVERGALQNLDEYHFHLIAAQMGGNLERLIRWLTIGGMSPQRKGWLLGPSFARAHLHDDLALERGIHTLAKGFGADDGLLTAAYAADLSALDPMDRTQNKPQSMQDMEVPLRRLKRLLEHFPVDVHALDARGVPVVFGMSFRRASLVLPVLLDHGLNPNLFVPASSRHLPYRREHPSLMGQLIGAQNLSGARLLAARGFKARKLPDRGEPMFDSPISHLQDLPQVEVELDPGNPGGIAGGVIGGVVGGRPDDPISHPQALLAYLLQDLSVDPNTATTRYSPALVELYRKGQLDLVKTFEAHGARLTAAGQNVPELLETMAHLGRSDLLQHALGRWPNVWTFRKESGFRALAAANTAAAVRVLLKAGAPVRCQGKDLPSPVVEATKRPESVTLRLLLEAGADPNPQWGSWSHEFPLMLAAVHPKSALFGALLLKHGADPNAEDLDGRTPLIQLIFQSSGSKGVEQLLAWGASPNQASRADGWTPLMEAAMQNHLPALDLLRAAGAKLEARNIAGETALEVANRVPGPKPSWFLAQLDPLAIAWVKAVQEVSRELSFGDWPAGILNRKDEGGLTAVHWAIQLKRWDKLEALLGLEPVDWDSRDRIGRTALQALEGLHENEAKEFRERLVEELANRKSTKGQ